MYLLLAVPGRPTHLACHLSASIPPLLLFKYPAPIWGKQVQCRAWEFPAATPLDAQWSVKYEVGRERFEATLFIIHQDDERVIKSLSESLNSYHVEVSVSSYQKEYTTPRPDAVHAGTYLGGNIQDIVPG